MGTIIKYGLVLAIGIAVLLWLFSMFSTLFTPRFSGSSQPASAIASIDPPERIRPPLSEDGAAVITGYILMDNPAGTTQIPYIQYPTENGGIRTKQLIFSNGRGCSVHAGDLPCVNMDDDAAYPQLRNGDRVRATGRIISDRFLIYDLVVL